MSEYDRSELLDLASTLIERAGSRGKTIVTAESCTGGLVSEALTAIPGSSRSFWGAFVTYSNAAKTEVLGVPADLIESKGAVSEEVVSAMVGGALSVSGTDVAVAVSGIAGPDGGTDAKPVGTVWIGYGVRGGEVSGKLYHFGGDREAVRHRSAAAAMSLLL